MKESILQLIFMIKTFLQILVSWMYGMCKESVHACAAMADSSMKFSVSNSSVDVSYKLNSSYS